MNGKRMQTWVKWAISFQPKSGVLCIPMHKILSENLLRESMEVFIAPDGILLSTWHWHWISSYSCSM